MSLRTFHLLFILCSIIGADLFCVWAIVEFDRTHDPIVLILGLGSLAAGIALTIYGVQTVKRFDRAHIH